MNHAFLDATSKVKRTDVLPSGKGFLFEVDKQVNGATHAMLKERVLALNADACDMAVKLVTIDFDGRGLEGAFEVNPVVAVIILHPPAAGADNQAGDNIRDDGTVRGVHIKAPAFHRLRGA